MKSLVAALMALTAVFAFTSTTAASAASTEDKMIQRITDEELAEEEAIKMAWLKQAMEEAAKRAEEERQQALEEAAKQAEAELEALRGEDPSEEKA